VACRLYGREGYHAVFLKPLAKVLGCEYVELDYMSLYRRYVEGKPGVYYVEEPWLYEAEGEAPEPPGRLPSQLSHLAGRMLPILGNVQAAFKAPFGKCLGLLAKPGEPLVTDLFLPLYLIHRDVKSALAAAREVYRCAPRTPRELVEGARAGAYAWGVMWTAWASDVALEAPPWGPISGIWGLTWRGLRPTPLYAYAYPPPYLDAQWGEWKRHRGLLEAARPLRGPGWMKFVEKFHKPLYKYLLGEAEARDVAEVAKEVESYLASSARPWQAPF